MARSKAVVPPFRIHKATGQGYANIDGVRHYLGRADDPATLERYNRLIGERVTTKRTPIPKGYATVSEVLDRFWTHALGYYGTADGEPSNEAMHFKRAMGPLRKLYGLTPAKDFGPLALKVVRDQIASGGKGRTRSRRYVNALVQRLKATFKWAAGEELVPASVSDALNKVAGLKLGRCELPEGDRVEPVDPKHVDAVLPFLTKPLQAVVRLQLLTGARGGEILKLRPIDLDTTGDVWRYRVIAHKGAWRGHSRTIHIGPERQTVLREFLDRPVESFCFSPRDAVANKAASAETHRRANQQPTPRKSDRTLGDCYLSNGYARAVARACVQAGVPHWHPHQLRHLAGTILRARYGIETARCVLGHKDAGVTLIYAEQDEAKIVEAMKKIG